MKIFISYSHKDEDQIQHVIDELSIIYDVWIDKEDINYGTKWKEEITKGIKCCNVFILFVSNNSLNSKYCNEELDIAVRFNKKIIPILVEEVTLPKQLNELQCIYLSDIYKLFNRLSTKFNIQIFSVINTILLLLNILLLIYYFNV